MTKYRYLLYVLGAVVIAVGAYGIGRIQRGDDATAGARVERGAGIATPQPAKPAQSPTVPRPPFPVPGQQAAQVPTDKYEQFRVGGSNVKALLTDGPIVWIGTSKGVIKYDTRTREHKTYNNATGLLSNSVFHLSKVGGELWVGTYGGGLSVLEPGSERWRNYNVPNGMGDAFVYDALQTKTGDIWIATWSGANRIIGGKMDDFQSWELHTVENTGGGLPNDWVYGLAEGKNGEIWLATEGGLARFADGKWSHWSHAEGLGAPFDAVKADITIKNDPGQVSRHHAEQKAQQGLGDVDIAYNPNYIVSMVVDDQGRVWTGTWGGGLSVFDGVAWKTFTRADGLPANHVFMLETDDAGNLWIGTNGGLARYRDGSFTHFGRKDGLYSDNVFSMASAANGDLWIGSFGGVTQFRGGLSAPERPATK